MVRRKQAAAALGKKRRSTSSRSELEAALKRAKGLDMGRGEAQYNMERRLVQLPFGREIENSVRLRLEKARHQPIIVLDKGAGSGNVSKDIKMLASSNDRGRISITAISLTNNIAPRNAAFIEERLIGAGIRADYGKKFDVIIDGFAEDYHLPKSFQLRSIEKSISELKNGGELFTVLPLVYEENEHGLTVEEGKSFVRALKKFKGLKVRVQELRKRFDRKEYVDLVLHVTKTF